MRLAACLCAALLGLAPVAAPAQGIGGPLAEGMVQSPVLVIDFDRVFTESAFGERINAEIERDGSAIAAENRRIEAELIEEERRLTELRPTMAPEAFRELADDFDEKVQRLRDEQDSKARALGNRSDEARRQFLGVAQPVLEQLMRETGAMLILERRAVFVAADAVDVTERAITLIDEEIGTGADVAPGEGVDLPSDPAASEFQPSGGTPQDDAD